MEEEKERKRTAVSPLATGLIIGVTLLNIANIWKNSDAEKQTNSSNSLSSHLVNYSKDDSVKAFNAFDDCIKQEVLSGNLKQSQQKMTALPSGLKLCPLTRSKNNDKIIQQCLVEGLNTLER